MEIFLLLVLILLLVLFNSANNSKISKLEKKLSNIEEYLKKIQFVQSQQSPAVKTEKAVEEIQKPITPITQPPVIEAQKTEEPVILPVNDLKQQPIKEEKKPEIKIQEPVRKSVQQTIKLKVPKESWYESFRKNNPDLEKFIGENILSKVAITILVISIAFFVKFAIDKEWINETARTGIGVLCGVIVLGFAHRLHKKFKAFSSVLVAGGIAIFYFTIGIAFHQYHLFGEGASGQTIAFILMLLITVFSVFISVVYDRVELAALSLIGGFAVPFMLSTGSGNHMVLFTYILILDIGMLALAYMRKWNLINIMAYVFTMLLYFGWLETSAIGKPNPPYKSALIFAAVFYVVFVLMNIINNIKEKRKFGVQELSILISNTFLFYGIGMQILTNYHPELKGLFSLLLAIFNLVCSWLLYKKFKSDTKLVYLMIGLTLTFITLIAPVQLQGNYITIFWALESVLLIWLAQKSNIVLYRFASIIITALMIVSLFMDWTQVYAPYHELALAVLVNKGFITGLVSSFSLLGIVFLLRKETESFNYLGFSFHPKGYSRVLSIGSIVLLYFTGLLELIYQLNETIAYGASIAIIIGAYHLLFFSLVNLAINKFNNDNAQVAMYVINFINSALFVLFFTTLPIIDFKESVFDGYSIQVGFIFHYVSIACFIFTLFQMRRAIAKPNTTIKFSESLNTILLSIAVLYLSSSELILHVLKLTFPVTSDLGGSSKYILYDTIETHIIKIGFPILWGILAFLFLFIGMKRSNKTFRIIGLIVIGATLIKLFAYDIKDASDIGKIVSFFILAVVLLIISFMYQKIKALLLDDVKKEESKANPE